MKTNYARWFCKETTGHDRTWPEWANTECPRCKKPFHPEDAIIVRGKRVYHYDCFQGKKPPFTYHIVW